MGQILRHNGSIRYVKQLQIQQASLDVLLTSFTNLQNNAQAEDF